LFPPLFGDIEAVYSAYAALLALMLGSAASVATLVGAVLVPDSWAWLVGLAGSVVLEVLMRTGMLQQPQLWAARRLAMRLGLDWPVHMAQTSALKLVYLHSLAGTGYVAPTMVLCIGCLRAATFGDPAAIVWLDASPTVPWVLLAQLCQRIIVDVTLRAARKRGLQLISHLDSGFSGSVRS
jgi:hypothetical protein